MTSVLSHEAWCMVRSDWPSLLGNTQNRQKHIGLETPISAVKKTLQCCLSAAESESEVKS